MQKSSYVNTWRLARLAALLVAFALVAGCSDDGTDPGTLDRLFTYPVITSCKNCHSGADDGPDLSKAGFQQGLVNKTRDDSSWTSVGNGSYITAEECSNKTYIVAGNPSKSGILSIVAKQNDLVCGAYNYHAIENATLSGAALEDLRLWIENGAKD